MGHRPGAGQPTQGVRLGGPELLADPESGLRLAVIGDISHARDPEGHLHTHAALALQLDEWYRSMGAVRILGHDTGWPGPADMGPYRTSGQEFVNLPEAGGHDLRARLRVLVTLPSWLPILWKTMRWADVVHLRAPCNVTLLGIPMARLAAVNRYAIYAGPWWDHRTEAVTWRLQRRLLQPAVFDGIVHAYTVDADDQSGVIANYSPALTDEETAEAISLATVERHTSLSPNDPLRLVSIGRLTTGKNHITVIRALGQLHAEGLPVRYDIVGVGIEHDHLRAEADALGLGSSVRLRGQLARDKVHELLRAAHINVLPTEFEGFGKVLLEGMADGAVTVASESPIARFIVTDDRGVRFEATDPSSLAAVLRDLAADPQRRRNLALAGQEHARHQTIDQWGRDLQRTLRRRFAVLPTDGHPDGSALFPERIHPAMPRIGVLHVIDSLAPGGAERMAIDLANMVDPSRFRSVLAATREGGSLESAIADHVRYLIVGRRSTWDPEGFRKLRWLTRRFDCSIVHSHGRSSMAFVSAARGLRLLPNTRHVFHDHFGSVAVDPALSTREVWAAKIGVDQVLGVDPRLCATAERQLGFLPSQISLVLNGVDLDPFDGILDPTVRQEFGVDNDEILVSVLANIRPMKDHETLLGALKRSKHVERLRVLLIGDQPDTDHARKVLAALNDPELKGRVQAVGRRSDVPRLLQASDLGLLSSRSESGPLAVLEYMAASIPWVVTDTGSITELIRESAGGGTAGFVVPVGDERALTTALDRIIETKHNGRRRMGKTGRVLAASQFDQRSTASQVAAIYDQLLARP